MNKVEAYLEAIANFTQNTVLTQNSPISQATKLMAALNFVNFDFLPNLNMECAFPDVDYISKLLFTTLGPIFVCMLIILVLWPIKRSFRKAVTSSISKILTISFLVFISTSSTLFGYFKTDEIVDTGITYLELDYTVDVHKSRYTEMQGYAVAMLFVYPLGIPALYFVLLFRERKKLMNPERTDEESKQVSYLDFLAKSYKPEYWYMEVFECFRRLYSSAALVFVTPGSATQAVVAFVVVTKSTFASKVTHSCSNSFNHAGAVS